MIETVFPIIDPSVRGLCCKPYPNHKKGCPNFGKKAGCPPQAPMFDRLYDLAEPVYAIYSVFDLRSHVERMRAAHPEWSDRQLKCCLYWQPKARKVLAAEIASFKKEHKGQGFSVTTCPEAMGVNVTETMKNAGVFLEWPPENVTYQIALAGKVKGKNDGYM